MTPRLRPQGHDLETAESADRIEPLVASVVVNYDGLDDTRRCVQSLLASSYGRHQVVVVDNGSHSRDAALLSAEFGDRIRVVASGKNLGYGGGANLSLRWAIAQEATYARVLNNDTTVDPGCIRKLVDTMESNTGYGILSPQISAPIGPEAPYGIWFSGGRVLLGRAETRHSFHGAPGAGVVETDYVTGCAMFIRCATLAEVGLFWEPLFLYWEEVGEGAASQEAGADCGHTRTPRRHRACGEVAGQSGGPS